MDEGEEKNTSTRPVRSEYTVGVEVRIALMDVSVRLMFTHSLLPQRFLRVTVPQTSGPTRELTLL